MNIAPTPRVGFKHITDHLPGIVSRTSHVMRAAGVLCLALELADTAIAIAEASGADQADVTRLKVLALELRKAA